MKTYRNINWNIFPWNKNGNSFKEIECIDKYCKHRQLNKTFFICVKSECVKP